MLAPFRRSWAVITGVAALALPLAACGSSASNQGASEPNGNYTVSVSSATFPPAQRLAQRTQLVITVRNTGTQPIPNLAITICNITCAYRAPNGAGTSAQAFSQVLNQPGLSNPSRPIWIVNRPPGPCEFSCVNGGPGAYVTAYSNTWALGRKLGPGQSARFDWGVTAVTAGTHVVAWQVAGGLDGKAKAMLADGSQPRGTFVVHVTSAPRQSYINSKGQIVFKTG